MFDENKQLWDGVMSDIEIASSRAVFNTWFNETFIVKIEDCAVYVGVPSEFIKTWLHEKYHKMILQSLRERYFEVRSVEYIIAQVPEKYKKIFDTNKKHGVVKHPLPLEDLKVNKDDNLNPKYTFDNFVVGPFNELAYAAGRAIIEQPGINYNPLFVYGETGLGKTHLLQSIGNIIKNSYDKKRVVYITSERFTNEYIGSVQKNQLGVFKEKYRKFDVFIMDDIQFLSRKEKTQEELFHLFNSLHDHNKQIIFSSDKHPNYLPDLESRLISRFNAGMIVEIIKPDFESRAAILKSKASSMCITISNDCINYLAEKIEGSIRELEGILNTIQCKTNLNLKSLTLDGVKEIVRFVVKPKKIISTEEVINTVASFYKIDKNLILEKTRRKEIVKPRQIIMFILREGLSTSYPTIGNILGGRDHTTVIHSYEKIKEDLRVDPVLNREIEQIKSMLK